MQVCTSLQTDNHANTPPLKVFYRPDALAAAQPTASKHRKATWAISVTKSCCRHSLTIYAITTVVERRSSEVVSTHLTKTVQFITLWASTFLVPSWHWSKEPSMPKSRLIRPSLCREHRLVTDKQTTGSQLLPALAYSVAWEKSVHFIS